MGTVTTSTSSDSCGGDRRPKRTGGGAECTWPLALRVVADRVGEQEAKVKENEEYLKSLGGVGNLRMLRSVLASTIAAVDPAGAPAEIRELFGFVEEGLKLAERVQRGKAFFGRIRAQIATRGAQLGVLAIDSIGPEHNAPEGNGAKCFVPVP